MYESRVGDVFVLGASSWRIEDITPDRVLVTPAPGQPGRLPFWHGDTPGRPAELGRAIGAACRELAAATEPEATRKLEQAGLDELAARNLLRYLADQRAATGYVPDDRTLVVERFRDELGDWRVVLHSPYGDRVHAPWALAIAARLRERYGGMDVQALHTDDGILIRVPDSDEPPPTGIALLDPEEIGELVTAEVGASALFASRFRECASRALLLPRRQPGRRTPLWQQRQRSAQLLEIASRYPAFPIVLETVRECLQDVFDVPALTALLRDIAARRIRIVEVETATPSPFGKSLLFRYVGAFMYEGDAPLAERRAQALSLDTALLAELLGQDGLRELLDPAVIAEVERDLQHLSEGRRCRDLEGVADLLRTAGPLTPEEAEQRCADPAAGPGWLAELSSARRAIAVRVAGQPMWAAIEDAGRLRDALGVPLPLGVPEVFTEPVADPLGDLVTRYARTHGPFTAATVAARYGLGPAVVTMVLRRLAAAGRVVEGEFLPAGQAAAGGTEWCDAEVLRLLRRRCLARLRREAEPVPPEVLARFLPAWHGIGGSAVGEAGVSKQGVSASGSGASGSGASGSGGRGTRRRADAGAVLEVVERLAGAPVPASALETLVLPGRMPGYSPALLDELTSAGEVVWAGNGALPGGDGWVVLAPADSAPLMLPEPGEVTMTPVHTAVLEALGGGGALFFRTLSDRTTAWLGGQAAGAALPDDREVAAAVWDLVWAGLLTNDTLAPLRVALGSQQRRAAPAAAAPLRPRAGAGGRRYGFGRPPMPTRTGPPTVSGRWSLLPGREPEGEGEKGRSGRNGAQTLRAHTLALTLLERHGVLTRGAVAAERIPGGFAAVYPVLRAMEEAGQCRRGYFVEGLGAAQFALPGAVDRMRAWLSLRRRDPLPPGLARLLAAADPAQPYGAALPWPERPGETPSSHRPGRKAGALVVLADGSLVLYVERGGKTLLSWTDDPELLRPSAMALASAVRDGALGRLTVERADGLTVGHRAGAEGSPLAQALEAAGFRPTPRGLRLRAG